MIKIYTDGSYKPSVNCGGYAAVITIDNSIIKVLYEGFKNTTNNRMEMMGVLESLKYFKIPNDIEIYSDSSYIVNSINFKHLDEWIHKDDKSKKNMDLWKQIYPLLKFHKVKFFWVKGHNNNEFNELADLYANNSAIVLNPKIDLTNEY